MIVLYIIGGLIGTAFTVAFIVSCCVAIRVLLAAFGGDRG